MNGKLVDEKLKALDGISLPEWNKIEHIINESFRKKEKELEIKLKLSYDCDVCPTIRALFG